MNYFLLAVADCNGDITTCCSDYGLAVYLHIVQEGLKIIHFVVPAILILMATINLVQLVLGPDDPQKKKMKSLINKFLAATFVFFVPTVVNVIFGTINSDFNVISCWNAASVLYDDLVIDKDSEVQDAPFTTTDYSKNYKAIKITPATSTQSVTREDISAPANPNDKSGEAIVAYAKKFRGGKYVHGGNSLKTGVDCSGFIQQIYKKFGINLPRKSSQQVKVGVEIGSLAYAKPGDLLFYCGGYRCTSNSVGHVALYEGNGKIIHASSPSTGIREGNADYKKILHIRRVIK